MPPSSPIRPFLALSSAVVVTWALAACGGKIDYGPVGDGSGAAAKGEGAAPDASPPALACGGSATALASGCVRRLQGGVGSTSCKTADTWRTYAAEDCTQQGLQLQAAETCDPCGSSFETVQYVCCPSAPPASSFDPEDAGPEIDATPPGCHEEADGVPTCQSYAELQVFSAQRCAAEGLSLGLVEAHQRCPQGGYQQVFWTCCGGH
jgi:hypothetical protein